MSFVTNEANKHGTEESQSFVDVSEVICTAESTAASIRLIGTCPLVNSDSDSEADETDIKDFELYKDGDLILGTRVIGSIRSPEYSLRNQHMQTICADEQKTICPNNKEGATINTVTALVNNAGYKPSGERPYLSSDICIPTTDSHCSNKGNVIKIKREMSGTDFSSYDITRVDKPEVSDDNSHVKVKTVALNLSDQTAPNCKTVFHQHFDAENTIETYEERPTDNRFEDYKSSMDNKRSHSFTEATRHLEKFRGVYDNSEILSSSQVPTSSGSTPYMQLNISEERNCAGGASSYPDSNVECIHSNNMDIAFKEQIMEENNKDSVSLKPHLQSAISDIDGECKINHSSTSVETNASAKNGNSHKNNAGSLPTNQKVSVSNGKTMLSNLLEDESVEYDAPFSIVDTNDGSNESGADGLVMQGSNNTLTEKPRKHLGLDEQRVRNQRFNPFDLEVVFNDDHFSTSEESGFQLKQGSSKSSSGSPFSTLSLAEIDTDISYAELGLAEDYFSRPEGHFGMTGVEELEMAIDNCKELIYESEVHSEKHKNLVKKLVQLRLRVQELKEGDFSQESDIRTVVGHKFQLKGSGSSKHYCEKCNSLIWGMLQFWYRCTECGYCSHDKCLNLITRTCASVKVQENPSYILAICPERGLTVQGYRCAECRLPISLLNRGREARLCDYTGNFYCDFCHWNDLMVIPARVTHNWDFEPRKVCRASKQFLRLMFTRSVLCIQNINPMLFNFVEELHSVKKTREEFLIMKKYFLCCQRALEEKLLLQLKGRQHFVENSDMYSLKDLVDIHSETLVPELDGIHSLFTQHIMHDCELCRVKGFICEICSSSEILFPFDNISTVCSRCSYVLHRNCYLKAGNRCPRCERREQRGDT